MQLRQFLLLSPIDKVLVFLIFIFPSLAATVRHGGTTVFALLILISLFSTKATIKSISESEKKVLYGFLIFVAVMLFGFINTDDHKIAIHQLERYFRLVMLIPIFLMLIKKNIDLSRPFLYGVILAGFVMAIQAYVYVEVLNQGTAKGAYNKIIFGDVAVIIAGISIAGLLALGKSKKIRMILILGGVLGLYSSIYSYNRASWLAVIAMIILFIILYKNKITNKQWGKVGLGLAALLIIGSIWQPKHLSLGIKGGINDIKQYKINPANSSSFGDRINMWHAAWLLFLEKPVTGIGVGDYRHERKRLIDEGKVIKTYAYGHAHNYYLNVLAENGIIGLFSLLMFIFFLPMKAFYLGWKNAMDSPEKKFWSLTGLIVLTCFFIFGSAEVWFGRNPMLNVYCILVVVSLSGLYTKKMIEENS